MTANDRNTGTEKRRFSSKLTLLLCGLILLSGALVTVVVFSTEPKAERVEGTLETAMLVDVIQVRRNDFRPVIQAMGTVVPALDIALVPQVSGEIIERHAGFTPGGVVAKGETLVLLDARDYEHTLRQRRSDLSRARADLALEMGRQEVARREYQLLEDSLPEDDTGLVLREPHLQTAKAAVETARAAVDQAELALSRTRVTAPFDALVLNRNADIGSHVEPGASLGRLVGLDTYWVSAALPLSKLRWLDFSDDAGKQGAEVHIINRTAWADGVYRAGRLDRLVGLLEEQTRMARVLISVDDPMARQSPSADMPAMIIGTYVEARIRGKEISDVIRLRRDYVRTGDTVWVMADSRLAIRNVGIVFQDDSFAYIRDGLNTGDLVVTSSLATVAEGARLRLAKEGQMPAKRPSGPALQGAS